MRVVDVLAQLAAAAIGLAVSTSAAVKAVPDEYITMEPTPTDAEGLPFSAPDLVPQGWDGGVQYGNLVERDGIPLREVTFGWRVPNTSWPAVVHINSITDRRRTNISFGLLHAVEGADKDLWVRSYLLPEDSIWTYRFVSNPELTVDIGKTRDGWLKFFSWGVPDPHNLDRLPTPLDPTGQSSVFKGKTAPLHSDWSRTPGSVRLTSTPLVLPIDVQHQESRTVTLHHRKKAASKLLVLLDGETWRNITSPDPITALGWRDYDILMLDNVPGLRSRDLPDPETFAPVLDSAIRESEKVLGVRRRARDVVVTGQSFGALAAANIVVRRPDLATTAVAQSGSYWYTLGNPSPPNRIDTPGDLLNYMAAETALKGRVVVQVGSDEQNMTTLSREFTARAQQLGLHVSHREWRGGHDYAWWRHGLSFALDELKDGDHENDQGEDGDGDQQ